MEIFKNKGYMKMAKDTETLHFMTKMEIKFQSVNWKMDIVKKDYLLDMTINKIYLSNTILWMVDGTESVLTILKMAILNKKEIWKIVMDNLFIMI